MTGDGGVRTPTVVFGGAVPQAAKGRTLEGLFSITDWYGVFADLAGIDGVPNDGPAPPDTVPGMKARHDSVEDFCR